MSPMVRRPLTMEYALLGLLVERPRHGYELHQALADPDGLGLIWHLKHSHLYALLGKLEADGYVTARLKRQETRPTRRMFRLTRSGRAAYGAWVRAPVAHARYLRQEFLAKLYFAQRLGPAAVRALMEKQEAVVGEWLQAQRTAGAAPTGPPAASFRWIVGQFRLGQLEAMRDWLALLDAGRVVKKPLRLRKT